MGRELALVLQFWEVRPGTRVIESANNVVQSTQTIVRNAVFAELPALICEEETQVRRYMILVPCVAVLAAGCARTYRPPIDPTFSTEPALLERDLVECEQIARAYAEDPGSAAAQSGATGAVGGAAVGAAIGAIAGAITGSAGTGAAVGAATGGAGGAIGGAARGSTSARSQFETAYDACMRNRGYKLLK